MLPISRTTSCPQAALKMGRFSYVSAKIHGINSVQKFILRPIMWHLNMELLRHGDVSSTTIPDNLVLDTNAALSP